MHHKRAISFLPHRHLLPKGIYRYSAMTSKRHHVIPSNWQVCSPMLSPTLSTPEARYWIRRAISPSKSDALCIQHIRHRQLFDVKTVPRENVKLL